MPHILMIAGCNGAGKTTFAGRLSRRWPTANFINADEIARDAHSGSSDAAAGIWAGRRLIELLDAHIRARSDIMLETTLATRRYLATIPKWRALGYGVDLYYLRLPTADDAVARVARRVAAGGHNIPEHVIRRRFARSLGHLELYKPLVNAWYLFDNSDSGLDFIMTGSNDG